jgi:hypothetical protein
MNKDPSLNKTIHVNRILCLVFSMNARQVQVVSIFILHISKLFGILKLLALFLEGITIMTPEGKEIQTFSTKTVFLLYLLILHL